MRVFSAYLLGLAVTGAPLHAQIAQQTAALAVAVEACADPAPAAQSVAATVTAGGKGDAESKIEAMRAAGIVVADSPATLGEAVQEAIAKG
jgi:succinyl-CoA synthetase alpha subunit